MNDLETAGGAVAVLGRLVRKWLHVALDVCLLLAIILMLWAAQPAGVTGTEQDADALAGKLKALDELVASGQPSTSALLEKEINAYLARKVQQSAEGGEESFRVEIESLNVALQPEKLVFMLVTDWSLKGFSKKVSCEVTGVPKIEKGVLRFDVVAGRLGRLPLPGPGATWLAGKVATIFSESKKERDLLQHVDSVQVTEGQVLVGVNTVP